MFGIKRDVRGNIAWVDEQQAVYVAGSTLVVYSADVAQQRFAHGGPVGCIAVSPNKRFVAVGEKTSNVVIYDLTTLRRKKVLSSEEREFVSIAFSLDSKLIATIGAAPEFTLNLWSWEKAKVTLLKPAFV